MDQGEAKTESEEMKQCTKCGEWKPLSEFRKWIGKCKECEAEYRRKYRKDHREAGRVYTRKWREGLFEMYRQILLKKFGDFCPHCFETYPFRVYHFHHLDPTQKEIEISKLLRCKNKERFLKEVAKCVMLCANCHLWLHEDLKEGKEVFLGPRV